MTKINTNVASLRGLRILASNNNKLNTSLERLSTGLKINSGKDDPAGLIASESLRSQITVIEQSIKNSNRANNVIAATDSALSEISGLLNEIRGLVQEGLNTGALSQSELEANQSQIDNALSAVNRISANAIFAGDKLIDGSKSFTTTATAADEAKLSDTIIDSAVFAGSSSIVVDATITSAATRAELFTDFVNGGLATSTTLEVSGSKGTDIVFVGKAQLAGQHRKRDRLDFRFDRGRGHKNGRRLRQRDDRKYRSQQRSDLHRRPHDQRRQRREHHADAEGRNRCAGIQQHAGCLKFVDGQRTQTDADAGRQRRQCDHINRE